MILFTRNTINIKIVQNIRIFNILPGPRSLPLFFSWINCTVQTLSLHRLSVLKVYLHFEDIRAERILRMPLITITLSGRMLPIPTTSHVIANNIRLMHYVKVFTIKPKLQISRRIITKTKSQPYFSTLFFLRSSLSPE